MKIVVSFSGGKDSLACLIWAVKTYGAKNVVAVFCDTGWEHHITYEHIKEVTDKLCVELVKVKSKKYKNFMDLAILKKRFPSTKARFCTEELKQKPMIDWVLAQSYDMLIVQGIRAEESKSRSKMSDECSFFKYYFQPYKIDKKGKKKYHTYRKKDAIIHTKQFASDIVRPVFKWTGLEVMAFIVDNGLKPNPLYYRGFSRVGCFPCVMCRHAELKLIIEQEPHIIDEIRKVELVTGTTFFPPGYIPAWACSGVNKNGKKFPFIDDVVAYLTRDKDQMGVFEEPETNNRCMSIYGLCE